jgi:hypothetical protein
LDGSIRKSGVLTCADANNPVTSIPLDSIQEMAFIVAGTSLVFPCGIFFAKHPDSTRDIHA